MWGGAAGGHAISVIQGCLLFRHPWKIVQNKSSCAFAYKTFSNTRGPWTIASQWNCYHLKKKKKLLKILLGEGKITHSGRTCWDAQDPQRPASLYKGSNPHPFLSNNGNTKYIAINVCHQKIHLLNYFKSKASLYNSYPDVYWIHNDNLISILHNPLIANEVKSYSNKTL